MWLWDGGLRPVVLDGRWGAVSASVPCKEEGDAPSAATFPGQSRRFVPARGCRNNTERMNWDRCRCR